MLRPLLKFLLASSLLFVAGCLSRPETLSGTLDAGRHVWQGEVRIVGDLEIPAGVEVVVRPGTRVVFMPAGSNDRFTEHPHFVGSELIVRGSLVAEGTASRPIEFVYVDTNAGAGSWGGINLMASPWSSFAYCFFAQADSAIHSQESTVSIEESIFEHNRVGIRFHSSQILIEHNLLQHNDTAIRFHFGAPVIRNNLITRNHKGLFITSSPQDVQIRNNLFAQNQPYHVVLGEPISADLDLSGNYWTDLASPNFSEMFFDHRRDPALGSILLEPYLSTPDSSTGPSWSR